MGKAYLRAKFHLDPSNHLATIHQRYRQTGQWSDSIGRTVLQMVAQKQLTIESHISQNYHAGILGFYGMDIFVVSVLLWVLDGMQCGKIALCTTV